jgi:hypothetical protein
MDYFVFAEGWRGWASALAGLFLVPLFTLAASVVLWVALKLLGLVVFALTH